VLTNLRTAITLFIFIAILAVGAAAQTTTPPPTPNSGKSLPSTAAKPDSIESRVEKYLRNAYAWGPSFDVKVGPTKPSLIPDLLEVPVTVTMAGQTDTAVVYVNKEGRFIVRGEIADMSKDPLADIRSKLNPGTSPSTGPQNAKVTIIEFADFECPSCRELDRILRDLLATHPDIRLVYKHFPLTEIHPWAMTAALASQCTYEQSPDKFWKIHDAIFDAQDVISPSNAWDKMMDLASQFALNIDAYKTCIADPATANQVETTIREGKAVNITATPTVFVNGRRIVGPDQTLLKQYVTYEHY
jgi:protein-disulfide isomerase